MAKDQSIPIPGLARDRPVAHLLGVMWVGSLLAFVVASFAQLVNEGLWRVAAGAAMVVALMLVVAWTTGAKTGILSRSALRRRRP